jgi:lipid A 3-O-deacylase
LTRLSCAAAVVMACAALSGVAAADSLSPDGAAVTLGQGHAVFVSGGALYWDGLCQCLTLKEHGFETRLVGQVSYWHAQQHPTEHGSLWDTGLTPFLRWLPASSYAVQPYVEAGVGIHVLSHTRINNDRNLSTAFQFGENAGAGIAFGEHLRYEFGVYIQHESNARIKEPNPGLTYLGGVLRVRFR